MVYDFMRRDLRHILCYIEALNALCICFKIFILKFMTFAAWNEQNKTWIDNTRKYNYQYVASPISWKSNINVSMDIKVFKEFELYCK